ncbi:MAG: hypothetical protein JJE48_10325 [Actinobacteria bacterium]|nr:hypothetical protein [Actinomycetota bacterium]
MGTCRSSSFTVVVALVVLALVCMAGCGGPAYEQGKPSGEITKYGKGHSG